MEAVHFEAHLGSYESAVAQTLAELERENIQDRIWAHDHTVWRPAPTEISNRLGWLHLPETVPADFERIDSFVRDVLAEGFTHGLLLGMGGSSLAPELFSFIFGDEDRFQLSVLDSTDPGAVLHYARTLPLATTLFIVATKSGGTVETLSFFKYFYNLLQETAGAAAGRQFVAITDPGSRLADLADTYNFRATFLNDPNIGGRYSALSHFGLVPAALVGVDIKRLLAQAETVSQQSFPLEMGAIMGSLAKAGRDKLTVVTSPILASFGDWAEQLIAESTGKEGKGIVPVVGERLGAPAVYGADRLFVHLHLEGSSDMGKELEALRAAGHPIVDITLSDLYDLGGQFLGWELATAVAGHVIDIQPFDQPNVEAAKILARQMVATYYDSGELPSGTMAEPRQQVLDDFLVQSQPGDYIALQAYLTPSAATDEQLRRLRLSLRDRYQLATTVGYGPRFLHSTGQLHKGDGGQGLFIQFVADALEDSAIPDEAGAPDSSMTFGVLERAQSLGDGQALQEADRRFLRINLGADVLRSLQALS